MAMDFPNTPATNEIFSSNSKTWRWDGSKWLILDQSINEQNQLYDIMVLMNMETN